MIGILTSQPLTKILETFMIAIIVQLTIVIGPKIIFQTVTTSIMTVTLTIIMTITILIIIITISTLQVTTTIVTQMRGVILQKYNSRKTELL
jgi:hypothetical protein